MFARHSRSRRGRLYRITLSRRRRIMYQVTQKVVMKRPTGNVVLSKIVPFEILDNVRPSSPCINGHNKVGKSRCFRCKSICKQKVQPPTARPANLTQTAHTFPPHQYQILFFCAIKGGGGGGGVLSRGVGGGTKSTPRRAIRARRGGGGTKRISEQM